MNQPPATQNRSLATAAEVAKEFNLPSAHMVNVLRRKRKIPTVQLGYRTLRYDLDAVGAALKKLTVKAI